MTRCALQTKSGVLEKVYNHLRCMSEAAKLSEEDYQSERKRREEYQKALNSSLDDMDRLKALLEEHSIPVPEPSVKIIRVAAEPDTDTSKRTTEASSGSSAEAATSSESTSATASETTRSKPSASAKRKRTIPPTSQ